MDRYAILVDAGYFFAAGAQALTNNSSTKRRDISVTNPTELLAALAKQAELQTSIRHALRVYWYDALSGPRPSIDQSALALQPGVKLRLGSLNSAGQQKGVDSLVVTDLIELARNRAITDAVVVSGDEDLRIAFQIAQSYGVRVHLLAVGDYQHNVSPALQMEADSVGVIDATWLASRLTIASPKAPTPIAVPDLVTSIEADPAADPVNVIARQVAVELLATAHENARTLLQQHFLNSTSVPPEFDRRLIAITAAKLGRQLTGDENRRIRGIFVGYVRSIRS